VVSPSVETVAKIQSDFGSRPPKYKAAHLFFLSKVGMLSLDGLTWRLSHAFLPASQVDETLLRCLSGNQVGSAGPGTSKGEGQGKLMLHSCLGRSFWGGPKRQRWKDGLVMRRRTEVVVVVVCCMGRQVLLERTPTLKKANGA
jgi:hypothetical protein